MDTRLARISQLSCENPNMVFTSIGHMIDKRLLRQCHAKMDGNKAVGIDGITKEDYEKDLEENLESLVERLKKKSYKPKPARRVEILKENGKTRPLSIYCYEDKLVQEALKEILEAVFEPHFYDFMMGFRPGRSCHMALRKLNVMLEKNKTDYAVIRLRICRAFFCTSCMMRSWYSVFWLQSPLDCRTLKFSSDSSTVSMRLSFIRAEKTKDLGLR